MHLLSKEHAFLKTVIIDCQQQTKQCLCALCHVFIKLRLSPEGLNSQGNNSYSNDLHCKTKMNKYDSIKITNIIASVRHHIGSLKSGLAYRF